MPIETLDRTLQNYAVLRLGAMCVFATLKVTEGVFMCEKRNNVITVKMHGSITIFDL